MFEDYYISQKPTVYPDEVVKEKVRDAKLNFGVKFHLEEHHMLNNPTTYEGHLRRRMAMELGDKMREENKLMFRSYNSPLGRTLEAETLIMTWDNLYALLGQFGIYVKTTKPKG